MTAEKAIRHQADDPKAGMTLDELAAFVQEAMRAGAPGTTRVRIDATWRSSIRRAAITWPQPTTSDGRA